MNKKQLNKLFTKCQSEDHTGSLFQKKVREAGGFFFGSTYHTDREDLTNEINGLSKVFKILKETFYDIYEDPSSDSRWIIFHNPSSTYADLPWQVGVDTH